MLYRILTENKNKPKTLELIDTYFEGFTAIEAQGRWKGKPEPSLIIEIDAPPTAYYKVLNLAQAIKEANGQESVGVQAIKSVTKFV